MKMTSKEALEIMKDECVNMDLIALIEKDLERLDQLKAIEKELGIDLITLFKALKNGIYDAETNEEECYVALAYDFNHEKDKKWSLLVFNYGYEAQERDYIENYGKTWLLTKEELENDKNIK